MPRGRPPALRSVPRATVDQLVAIRAVRGKLVIKYLSLLQEPAVEDHLRHLLTTADAKGVGAILNALMRVLVPPEESVNPAVNITLNHDVPRPPVDITPVP